MSSSEGACQLSHGIYQYQWFHYTRPIATAVGPTLTVNGFGITDGGPYHVDIRDQTGQLLRREFATAPDVNFLPFTDDFALEGANGFPNQLFSDSGFGLGDNSNATFQSPGEPVHAGITGGASLWLTWRPRVSGIASLSTAGSTPDTVVAVYRLKNPAQPAALANLQLITSNDDDGTVASMRAQYSSLRFNATADQLYFIAVDGKDPGPIGVPSAGRGLVVFAWTLQATPDVVPEISQQPRDVTATPGSVIVLSLELPESQLNNPSLTIQWFKDDELVPNAVGPNFTPNPTGDPSGAAGRYVAHILLKNPSGVIEEVYSRVVEVQIHDGNSLNNHLALDNFQKTPPGQAPAGRHAQPAGFTLSSSERHFFSIAGASTQPREPLFGIAGGGVGRPASDTFWYFVQAPETGVLVVDTAGSHIDTRLDIFDPDSETPDANDFPFDGLKELAFNDNAAPGVTWSRVAVACVQGQSFYVRILGDGSNLGLVQVNINAEGPLGTPSVVAPFQAILGRTARLPAAVTNETPSTLQWYFNNRPLPGQTNLILTLTSVRSSDDSAQFSLEQTSLSGKKTRSVPLQLTVLEPITRLDSNTLRFAFDELPLGQYRVQSSTDLNLWRNVLTNTGSLGSVLKLTNKLSPDVPNNFLRIVAP